MTKSQATTQSAHAVQTTLAEQVVLEGIGVHSGAPASVIIHPASPDTGILFVRTGLTGGREVEIPARVSAVSSTDLCTCLGTPRGLSIATVEHLMAALCGLGVDNAVVEIDSDEVPIMDGSAEAFVDAIDQVGLRHHMAPRKFIRVLKPVRFQSGDAFGELLPFDGRRFEIEIDFDSHLVGQQKIEFDLQPGIFRTELSRARTFGFMKDVERLWAGGFALGASLDNTVVIGETNLVNPEGLRYADEFVRHKALDAVGDLALAGAPILGKYRSARGGHKVNCGVVSALLADRTAWTMVEELPQRRESGHAEISAAASGPVYKPVVS
ncbi:MAG: UDP-3-O-acyl-N-acetylglucosamine deacetylase [Rhodobiaceae bacterium]|nr:UDP-3-O-acyl-N-acetylglucosamine deacetylase [Rhodobiaceae bacterium]